MFYMCDDPNFIDPLIVCSVAEARSFLFNHSNGWVFKFNDDGQVIATSMIDDFEV